MPASIQYDNLVLRTIFLFVSQKDDKTILDIRLVCPQFLDAILQVYPEWKNNVRGAYSFHTDDFISYEMIPKKDNAKMIRVLFKKSPETLKRMNQVITANILKDLSNHLSRRNIYIFTDIARNVPVTGKDLSMIIDKMKKVSPKVTREFLESKGLSEFDSYLLTY